MGVRHVQGRVQCSCLDGVHSWHPQRCCPNSPRCLGALHIDDHNEKCDHGRRISEKRQLHSRIAPIFQRLCELLPLSCYLWRPWCRVRAAYSIFLRGKRESTVERLCAV